MSANRSDVVRSVVQSQVNEFLELMGNKRFPILFETKDQISFSFKVNGTGEKFQVAIEALQVDQGKFILYITTCFRTDDKFQGEFQIDGVPLGHVYQTEYALSEVESEEDLYTTIYQQIRDSLSEHLDRHLM